MRVICVLNMIATAAVLQSHHGNKEEGEEKADSQSNALWGGVGGNYNCVTILLWIRLHEKQILQWWQLKLWKGAIVPVILASCGESHCHCVISNWHLQPQTKEKLSQAKLDSVGVLLEQSNLWPACCWTLTTALSVCAQKWSTCCQQGFFHSAGQLTQGTAGSWLWHSQQLQAAEKSFNVNKCHIHILDASPCMIMMDAQATHSQRSVVLFIIKCFFELFMFVLLESRGISNQIPGSC